MKEKIVEWLKKIIGWFEKNQTKISVSFLLSGVFFLVCGCFKDNLHDFYIKVSGAFLGIGIFFFPTDSKKKDAFIKKVFIYMMMFVVIGFVVISWGNLYHDSNSIMDYMIVATGSVLVFAFIIDVFQHLFKGISLILQKGYKKLFGDYSNFVNAVEKITSAIVAITTLIAAIVAFSQTIGILSK